MLDDILDRCLEDIRARRATADECLARYPDRADELAPLLRTALALQRAGSIKPSQDFKTATRARLLQLDAPAPTWGTRMRQFIVQRRAA